MFNKEGRPDHSPVLGFPTVQFKDHFPGGMVSPFSMTESQQWFSGVTHLEVKKKLMPGSHPTKILMQLVQGVVWATVF